MSLKAYDKGSIRKAVSLPGAAECAIAQNFPVRDIPAQWFSFPSSTIQTTYFVPPPALRLRIPSTVLAVSNSVVKSKQKVF